MGGREGGKGEKNGGGRDGEGVKRAQKREERGGGERGRMMGWGGTE